MHQTKYCPECRGEIHVDAAVCRHCGERIEGKQCPECKSMCRPDARRCRWCGRLFHESVHLKDFKEFQIKTTLLGTLLTRGNVFPQTVRFTKDRIVVTTFGFLGIYSRDEETSWDKVTGYKHQTGLLWDHLTIETRTQTPVRIQCLSKHDGQVVRRLLQSLEM